MESSHQYKSKLSPRQFEILCMIAEDKRDREIAHKLGISESTVSRHLVKAFEALGCFSRARAVFLLFASKSSSHLRALRKRQLKAQGRKSFRDQGLCVECGNPSKTYRCKKCRPERSPAEISKVRRAAALKRWHTP